MAGITTSGVGSGIDIKSLVQQLVYAETQPTSNRLDMKEARLQAQLSAFGTFKGALSSFQSSLTKLASAATFQNRTASSSDATIASATADSTAAAGTYQVEVTALAKAHSLRSQAFTANTSTVGTGTLTFQFGDASKPTQNVTIAASNNSLDGIAKAVNSANIGVQASVVKGTTGYHLAFTSTTTGTANSLKVSVSDSDGNNTDASGLSQLVYDPTGVQNMTQVQAAVDATAKINGIDVTSATNKIADFIPGVTFNLIKASPGTSVTMTIAEDKASVTSAVQGFIKDYNALVTTVKSVAGYDAETKKGGILIGDATVRGIMNQLRQAIATTTAQTDSAYRALADIGIKTQSDGTLALDSTKLNKALESGVEQVGQLFSAMGNTSDALVKYQSSTSDTKKGIYGINVSQLATKGTYLDAASSVSSLVVGATNDTFAIKVDGTQSGTITLTQKTYATGADLAAELQSRINGDSALKNAGVAVAVTYAGGQFTFTSNRYGSASNAQITSVENAADSGLIGLTTGGTTTAGVDVAGTIGGQTGSGSGEYLTGAGDAMGLKLQIQGSLTGDRGTVNFSRGIADQLSSTLTSLLGTNNILDARTKSINDSVKDITGQREKLAMRVEALTKRYTAQFTAMDKLVSQLNSTGSFLAQRLNAN